MVHNMHSISGVLHLHFIAIIHLLYELCIRMYGLGKSCLWIACHRALESLQGHWEPSLRVTGLYNCRNK